MTAKFVRTGHSVVPDSVPDDVFTGLSEDVRRSEAEVAQENEELSSRQINFPCLHPVNPHMRSSEARLQTFLDNCSICLAHRIRATPQQIVDAGMYYLGERDRVKCWYCNGGLQNWERDDDPMEEHAKWFPLCEFVLQQKGPDYVHQIVLKTPEVRRPLIPNSSSAELAEFLRERNTSGSPPSSTDSSTVVDPHDLIRDLEDKVNKAMEASELVGRAKMMGFSDYVIGVALMKYVLKRGKTEAV